MVESYLRRVVSLPLPGDADAPEYYPALSRVAVDLAFWSVLQDRREVISESDRATNKNALKFLEDIATGAIGFDVAATGQASTGARRSVRMVASLKGVDFL